MGHWVKTGNKLETFLIPPSRWRGGQFVPFDKEVVSLLCPSVGWLVGWIPQEITNFPSIPPTVELIRKHLRLDVLDQRSHVQHWYINALNNQRDVESFIREDVWVTLIPLHATSSLNVFAQLWFTGSWIINWDTQCLFLGWSNWSPAQTYRFGPCVLSLSSSQSLHRFQIF